MILLKRTLKPTIVELLRRRGYDLTPEWKLASRPLVRHLKMLLERYHVDCVLDVGGNLGQYRDTIREDVKFSGPIVSFEPVGRYAEVLVERAKSDPNWQICRYALGSAPGRTEIHVTQSPGLNSFLAPRRDIVEAFGPRARYSGRKLSRSAPWMPYFPSSRHVSDSGVPI